MKQRCPDEIADLLLEILYTAAVDIRGAAHAGDTERCHAQAHHIHNLPELLRHYRPELLKYYWNIERPCFISATRGENLQMFTPLWEQLEKYVPQKDEARPQPLTQPLAKAS